MAASIVALADSDDKHRKDTLLVSGTRNTTLFKCILWSSTTVMIRVRGRREDIPVW